METVKRQPVLRYSADIIDIYFVRTGGPVGANSRLLPLFENGEKQYCHP